MKITENIQKGIEKAFLVEKRCKKGDCYAGWNEVRILINALKEVKVLLEESKND